MCAEVVSAVQGAEVLVCATALPWSQYLRELPQCPLRYLMRLHAPGTDLVAVHDPDSQNWMVMPTPSVRSRPGAPILASAPPGMYAGIW